MANFLRVIAVRASLALPLSIFAGCNLFASSGGPPDMPGVVSSYSVMNFTNGALSDFCSLPNEPACFYTVDNSFTSVLTNANWAAAQDLTEGIINNQWTSPKIQANTILGDTPNLMYIGSHGGIISNQAIICLVDCIPGTTQVGGSTAIGIPDIPKKWAGPNWLLVDACNVVQPNVGWEGVFGGSLHGILGFGGNYSGLSGSSLDAFATALTSFSTAFNAWSAAFPKNDQPNSATMLIPNANLADVIEATGGPHFGYNNSTSPIYYVWSQNQFVPQTVNRLVTQPPSGYQLVGESMDENAWINQYGGNNVPHQILTRSNSHVWISAGAIVHHYLASGGLSAVTPATGTAQGIGIDDALAYAQSFVANNGGLPTDAALTYGGILTDQPNQYQALQGAPYPNNLSYMFIWRHSTSGVLGNDKIVVTVDDSGGLTRYTRSYRYWDPHCQCWHEGYTYYYDEPWVPQLHMSNYSRVWRVPDLRHPLAFSRRRGQRRPQPNGSLTGYAYCASDMAYPANIAYPCQVFSSPTDNTMVDVLTGGVDTMTENF